MLRIFIGTDPRQPVAFHVLTASILKHATQPVAITPIKLSTLPMKRRGLTEFTYSRWLPPWLAGYSGQALYMDADMLVRGDLAELFWMFDTGKAVSVVQGKHRFEWPSLMLFNCEHPDCRTLTPEYIDDVANQPASFAWTTNLGVLDKSFNHLVGYDEPNPDARVVHFTMGIPCWPETRGCEFSDEWNKTAFEAMSSVDWQELMGSSVHVPHMGNLNIKR